MRRSSMGSDTALVSVVCLGLLALIASSAGGGPAPVLGEQASAPGGGWVVLAGGHTAPGQFKSPSGVAVDGAGNLYVADSGNHRIQKLSPTGEPLAQWGTEGSAAGQFFQPGGVAVDSDGNIYVADGSLFGGPNSRIQQLSANGEPMAEWGTRGSAPGQFRAPQGIAVDGVGNIFVADTLNDRIQKLTAGRLPRTGGPPAEPPSGAIGLLGMALLATGAALGLFARFR